MFGRYDRLCLLDSRNSASNPGGIVVTGNHNETKTNADNQDDCHGRRCDQLSTDNCLHISGVQMKANRSVIDEFSVAHLRLQASGRISKFIARSFRSARAPTMWRLPHVALRFTPNNKSRRSHTTTAAGVIRLSWRESSPPERPQVTTVPLTPNEPEETAEPILPARLTVT
jgi:hypothetical protein